MLGESRGRRYPVRLRDQNSLSECDRAWTWSEMMGRISTDGEEDKWQAIQRSRTVEEVS